MGKLYSRLRREGSSFSRSRKRASEGSCCQSALSSCFDTGPNSNHVSSHPVKLLLPTSSISTLDGSISLPCRILILPAPNEPLRGTPGLIGWNFLMSGLRRWLLSSEGPVRGSSSGSCYGVDAWMSDVVLHTDFHGSV